MLNLIKCDKIIIVFIPIQCKYKICSELNTIVMTDFTLIRNN